MPIKLRCQCGKVLSAPDAAAGKAVKCPGCGKTIRVPTAAGSGAPRASGNTPAAKVAQRPKPVVAKPQAQRVPASSDDLGALFDEEGFSAKVEAVCPACRAEMPARAVLCTKCGYHKEKGTQLESHKTAGVDIDVGTLALEKAADDLVRDLEMQKELLKGGGMPWWMLAMIMVIGGGGIGIAVLGVNNANQEVDSERPGLAASLLLLSGGTFLFANLVCVLIIAIQAFKQSVVRGLLTIFTFPIYYLYHVVTNWKAVGKVFLAGLLFGFVGGACLWYGDKMLNAPTKPDDQQGNIVTELGFISAL